MGMGSAYAAGYRLGMPEKPQIIQPRGGLRSRGVTDRQSNLREQMYSDAQSRQRDIDNQFMATHAGRLPVPGEAPPAEPSFEESQRLARGEAATDRKAFDERMMTEREFGLKKETGEREFGLKEKEAEREYGLKQAKEGRAGEKHKREMSAEDMELDRERRTEDHRQMMQAFLTKDFNAVMGWFIRNAPKGKDGSMRFPLIEPGEQEGTLKVQWPGQSEGEAETLSEDELGEILTMMSPKWEVPESEKAMAETALKKSKSKGLMAPKDLEKRRIEYGKESAAGGEDFQAGYESYPMTAPQPAQEGGQGSNRLVRTQRDRRTGNIKETYADGSVIYKDRDGNRLQ